MTTIYLIGAAVTLAVLAFGSAWLQTGRKYKTSDKVYQFLFGAIIWPIVWLFAVGTVLGEIAWREFTAFIDAKAANKRAGATKE